MVVTSDHVFDKLYDIAVFSPLLNSRTGASAMSCYSKLHCEAKQAADIDQHQPTRWLNGEHYYTRLAAVGLVNLQFCHLGRHALAALTVGRRAAEASQADSSVRTP
jgi:hypothetical protein